MTISKQKKKKKKNGVHCIKPTDDNDHTLTK